MTTGPLRRWMGRAVVALSIAAAAVQAHRALVEAAVVWREARLYRREPFERAQERLVGREYMQSVRRIRAETPAAATLYLLDAAPEASGAPYFALHYLAPRRLVLLGTTRSERPNLIRSRLPRDAEWVVVTTGEGVPLDLVDADEFRPRHERRRRGR